MASPRQVPTGLDTGLECSGLWLVMMVLPPNKTRKLQAYPGRRFSSQDSALVTVRSMLQVYNIYIYVFSVR